MFDVRRVNVEWNLPVKRITVTATHCLMTWFLARALLDDALPIYIYICSRCRQTSGVAATYTASAMVRLPTGRQNFIVMSSQRLQLRRCSSLTLWVTPPPMFHIFATRFVFSNPLGLEKNEWENRGLGISIYILLFFVT